MARLNLGALKHHMKSCGSAQGQNLASIAFITRQNSDASKSAQALFPGKSGNAPMKPQSKYWSTTGAVSLFRR